MTESIRAAGSRPDMHTDAPAPPVVNPGASLVGECIDAKHPTLQGRVRVRWTEATGETQEKWIPTLHGTVVREGDRVVVVRPGNWDEPLVLGVVDGFAKRPDPPKHLRATLAVQPDEKITVTSSEGQPLLEVHQSDDGPEIKLLDDDVNLEIPGKLRINAKSLEMNANLGGVEITANDDVNVKGEVINLN